MENVRLRVGLATLISIGSSIADAHETRERSANENFPAQYFPGGPSARPLEHLDRGVVAVRSSDTEVLVSWRLLGLDPKVIAFDVERSTDSGPYRKLNNKLLTGGTNFVDAQRHDPQGLPAVQQRQLLPGSRHEDPTQAEHQVHVETLTTPIAT